VTHERRKVLVSITPDGLDLLDDALPAIQLVVRRLFGGLSDPERSDLLDLARSVYDSVTGADISDLPTAPRNRPNPPPT